MTTITQEQLRMQMLSGIITESQYKALLNEQTLSDLFKTGEQPVKILAKEIDNLIEDHPKKEEIVEKITDLFMEFINKDLDID